MLELETTIQSILFSINQCGPTYWRQLRDPFKANTDADLQNAASIPTEDQLVRAEELYDTAVSKALVAAGVLHSLDADSLEIIRQALSSVAVKAELGRRLDCLLRYLVTPNVLAMLPETKRMASPEQAQILATAWMASIAVLDSVNPRMASKGLARVILNLATCANGSHNGDKAKWPYAMFKEVPLDVTKHTPTIRDLQEEAFPADLSLKGAPSASSSTDVDNPDLPQVPVVFHPLQLPYKSQKIKRPRRH
ncbi:hypothetical protein ONZ45_g4036 [Pleurotus djamor]|nr:hypothetical protein ONZ45_g4036 [Pleurotus djamor]